MKGLIFALSLLGVSAKVLADVSPMELRIMQTRIFEKPPIEVKQAVVTLCEDLNLLVAGSLTTGLKCINTTPTISTGFLGTVKNKEGEIAEIAFSCGRPCKVEDEILVLRMRVKTQLKDFMQTTQSTDPAVYSKWFNEIAQYLFIEAIEWSPDVQH